MRLEPACTIVPQETMHDLSHTRLLKATGRVSGCQPPADMYFKNLNHFLIIILHFFYLCINTMTCSAYLEAAAAMNTAASLGERR